MPQTHSQQIQNQIGSVHPVTDPQLLPHDKELQPEPWNHNHPLAGTEVEIPPLRPRVREPGPLVKHHPSREDQRQRRDHRLLFPASRFRLVRASRRCAWVQERRKVVGLILLQLRVRRLRLQPRHARVRDWIFLVIVRVNMNRLGGSRFFLSGDG